MITLPKTDLHVYPLCLGGNVFGFSADVTNSEIVLDYYFDNGGNLIDTADMYSQWAPGHVGGESETIIGDWMKRRGNRKEMVIATKVAKLDTRPGLKKSNIIAACDDSLRRLQTDYIDIYYAHQDDPDTPIETKIATRTGRIMDKRNKTNTRPIKRLPFSTDKRLDIYEELSLISVVSTSASNPVLSKATFSLKVSVRRIVSAFSF